MCKNLTHLQFTYPKSTQRDSLPSANSTHLTKKRTKTLEWQSEICCSSPSSYLQGNIHASFSNGNPTFPLLSNQVQNNRIILNILHLIHLGRTPTPGLPNTPASCLPPPGSRWARSPPPPTSSSDPYRQRLRSRPIRELRRARPPPVGSGALGRGPPSRPPHPPPHPRPQKEGEGSPSLTYSSAPPQGHSALPSQGRERRAG